MTDVIFFDKIFSDCPKAYPAVNLKGLRLGYPTIWWTDLQADVSTSHSNDIAKAAWLGCCRREFGMQTLRGLSSVNLHGTIFCPLLDRSEGLSWCRPSLFMMRPWRT